MIYQSVDASATRLKTKAGQLSDLLRVRLLAGEWSGVLPSERDLAEEYPASRSTLRKALAILEKEGLLKGCRSTRAGRSVWVGSRVRRGDTTTKRVVMLTPSLSNSPLLLEHVAVLRELLGRSGVQVNVREAARLGEYKRPGAALQRIVAAHPRAVWILHKMPHAVQLAAHKLGLPALIYGSSFADTGLPSIDIDFRAVARHAAGRCLARGLRQLAVIVHRTPLAGDELIVESLTAELTRAAAPPLKILKHDFNRERLIGTLDQRIVPPRERPDALLIVNQHHLLTTLPHLLHRGLRIPADLSLVFLSNDHAAERLSPLPDRYDLGDRLLRRLAAAVLARIVGEMPASVLLLPRMVKGETLR